MNHLGLDHLAIVVPNTDEALKLWRDTLGFPLVCSEVVNQGAVRLTHLDLGNTHLQLVEPLTPDHPLRGWLAKNGGPGLHHFCLKVANVDEAIRVNNGVRYGLSSSMYTSNVQLAFRAMQELDTGITYINAPTIGAEAHLPFGGVKQTGNGHREGGWEVYDFYSETKVCYADYSGSLQRAQIDTYDV